MDPFEHLPEAPDLNGAIVVVSYKPVFVGPYSCIYRGTLRYNGEMVAIKVLNAVEGTALHTMRRKLNRERRTWGVLNHPNILPLYGFADDEETFQPFGALISPWRQLGDASKFFAQHGDALTLGQRIQLWKDVLSGVDYLHTHKPLLVHGDLKPRNILIDDSGRAQICDFGLVRVFIDEGSTGMTTTTQHTGTERYLAYELVMAGESAVPTTSSDIYAAGCIGLEFIFCKIPHSTRVNNFGGGIFVDIREGLPPARRPYDLPPHLEDAWVLLEDCWNLDPLNRPPVSFLLASLDDPLQRPTAPSPFQHDVIDAFQVSGSPAGVKSGLPLLSPRLSPKFSVKPDPLDRSSLFATRKSQRELFENCMNSSWLCKQDREPEDSSGRSILLGFLEEGGQSAKLVCSFDDCGMSFDQEYRALGHIREHLGHRPYACHGLCGKARCVARFPSFVSQAAHLA